MKQISEFYSDDGTKIAKTYIDGEIPVVEFVEGDQLLEVRSFPNNTLQYAEDAAENFVMGILKIPNALKDL